MTSARYEEEPKFGATFYPGGQDAFVMPELISPAPQRVMPEVPSNMQQELAYLELEANNPHDLYRREGTASAPIQEQYGASRNIVYQHQPANNLPQGYAASYGQTDGSHYQTNHPVNPQQPPPLPPHRVADIPLPSPFPSLQNPGPNVPPSDDEREEDLEHARELVLNSNDPERQLRWAQDALHWSDIAIEGRRRAAIGAENRSATPKVERRVRDDALNIAKFLAEQGHPRAEFMRASWHEFGKFGYPEDAKEAFSGYKRAAEKGYVRAEYRIGTRYESNKDMPRAIKHYQNGVAHGDSASNYRMGMMALLGQHGQPQNYEVGIGQVKYAADTADENAPQGAYVYGMLLARELPNILLPDFVLPYDIEQARHYIEQAALLGFPKAQLKMGSAYELCLLGCDFNPTLSLHYNRLAASQGEPEAEMAISKWFLCGYKGVFEKNEEIAFTYAKRAAKQEFPTAEFALGYFYEVGLNVPMDLGRSREWYQKAADHGNTDAPSRIDALRHHRTISRTDHEQVAIVRIKSQYGSRKGERPDRLLQKQSAPQLPTLPVMVEEREDTSSPNDPYPIRNSSIAPLHPPFRVVTPVPHDTARHVQPPFHVITPTPGGGGRSRTGSDPRINGHYISNPGGNQVPQLSPNSSQFPVKSQSMAPYPEDDMAYLRRPNSELAPLSGPPADRPNSAFGIKPLHPNHSLGQSQDPLHVRPTSSMGNLPSQQPQQVRGRPAGRGQPMVQGLPRRDGDASKDWESQYRPPYKPEMVSSENDSYGGGNRLQKQGPQTSKPHPALPSQRDSRSSQRPANQAWNDHPPNRPATTDGRNSASYSSQPRTDRVDSMLPNQAQTARRPLASHDNSQSSMDTFPPRNSALPHANTSPAVTISPAVSQSTGSKPPKKGPQTFEEMGVPAAPKDSECCVM